MCFENILKLFFLLIAVIRWGPKKPTLTTSDHQLAEAVALVDTLPGWKVVETVSDSESSVGTEKAYFHKNIMVSSAFALLLCFCWA